MWRTIKQDHTPLIFLKAVLRKFYLVHSWILCPIYCVKYVQIRTRNNSVFGHFWRSAKLNPVIADRCSRNQPMKKCEIVFLVLNGNHVSNTVTVFITLKFDFFSRDVTSVIISHCFLKSNDWMVVLLLGTIFAIYDMIKWW